MSVILQNARVSPLLSPPSENSLEWVELTAEDKLKIRRELIRVKFQHSGVMLAEMMDLMKEHNLPNPFSSNDLERDFGDITNSLHNAQSSRPANERVGEWAPAPYGGDDIAQIHYHLRRIGHPQEITGDDKKEMLAMLGWLRQQDDSGLGVMQQHLLLRDLDFGQPITDADKRQLDRFLSLAVDVRNGVAVAASHYCMEKLGINHQIKPDELAIMREEMDTLRKDGENNPYNLLRMHHFLKSLDLGQINETTPLPPLKKL